MGCADQSSLVSATSGDHGCEDTPFFLPDGDIVFRAIENGSNYLYRVKADGRDRRKVIPKPILELNALSPDGRWVVVGSPNCDEEFTASLKAVALDGKPSGILCFLNCRWIGTIPRKLFLSVCRTAGWKLRCAGGAGNGSAENSANPNREATRFRGCEVHWVDRQFSNKSAGLCVHTGQYPAEPLSRSFAVGWPPSPPPYFLG